MSHLTDAYNCPTKLKLNTMVEELLPPEVLEQEHNQETTDNGSSQVAYPPLYKSNKIFTGLNMIQPILLRF